MIDKPTRRGRRLLRTAIRWRCPACGLGPIFRRGFTVHTTCLNCGVRFDRYHGNWLGPTVLGYGVGALGALALGLWLVPRFGFFPGVSVVLVAGAAVIALLGYRFLKAWWIWLLWVTGLVFRDGAVGDDESEEDLRV